jgi:transcriptional regulator
MYLPSHFRENDRRELHAVMTSNSFATLVSVHDGIPFASHLPFLLDPDRGEHGTLLAHMARANPQWRDFADGRELLVIFQGPHRYITPSWYTEEQNVPTWNYVAVHAYGTPRIVDDPDQMMAMLDRLVRTNEAGFERPWELRDDAWTRGLLSAVVGFEMMITRLEGKFKLSQNRDADDHAGVVEVLGRSNRPEDREMAAMMASRCPWPRDKG